MVNANDYTPEQLNAWADGHVDLREWDSSFSKHYTLVAEKNSMIVGFGDIDNSGYLDKLFVHKDYQHKGIASAICDKLEKSVNDKVFTYASITAKPFFEKRGYSVIRERQVIRKGIFLTNYMMEKPSTKK